MSDEQLRKNLNEAMSQFLKVWRVIDPDFVAYVEKYGGLGE